MESFFNSERIMDEEELVIVHDLNHDHFHDHVSDSSCSSSSINGEDEDQEEDEDKEVNSSPLQDMSSLLLQLPIKRGLSKHYSGKSQSFTSLSNVKCVEDLAKPQNPFDKKLKTCKSYGGGFVKKHASSKKVQLNMRSQLFYGRRNSTFFNNNNKPPIYPPQVA